MRNLISDIFRTNRPERFLRLWPAVMLLLVAWLCLGWAGTWEGIRRAAESVTSVQADFVQEKHLPILARPLVSTGRLSYQRPDSLRWEYLTPVKSILLLHDGDARRFVPSDTGDQKLVEDAGAKMQAMQFVMPEISGWLAGRFDDNSHFTATLSAGGRIVMVPKDPAMARFIERIELVMGQTPGVIDEVVIHEGTDAFTRMVFEHTTINTALDERLFLEP